MLDDYKKAVISDYHYKKERGLLSSNMFNPTAAKLRKECLIALRGKTKKADEKVIREFFNSGEESNDYSPFIKRFDRDKLKPLDNFIKGETEVRDDKNVELLAWLIDFEPRPYNPKLVYTEGRAAPEETEIAIEIEDGEKGPDLPGDMDTPSNDINTSKKQIYKKAAVFIAIPLLLISGVYFYIDQRKVYICDHGTAKKYHLSNKCPALKNCKNSFVSTSITEAEKNGKTLCGFEIR